MYKTKGLFSKGTNLISAEIVARELYPSDDTIDVIQTNIGYTQDETFLTEIPTPNLSTPKPGGFYQTCLWGSIILSVICLLSSPTLLIFTLIPLIIIIVIKIMQRNKNKKYAPLFKMLKDMDFKSFNQTINSFNLQPNLGKHENRIILRLYTEILDDGVEEQEMESIAILQKIANPFDLKNINAYYISQIFNSELNTQISLEALNYINKLITTLNLTEENKDKFEKLLDKNRQFHAEPAKIEPSFQIKEDCYYEGHGKVITFTTLGRYSRNTIKYTKKGFKEKEEVDTLLTDKCLILIGTGTTKILFKNIMKIRIMERYKLISFLLSNRKEPVYLSTPDNVKLLSILSRLNSK
ncbi:hypothetical protein AAIR98_001373 [Elusimicrobium simillimum]|uniref:hypothetical protein n=1 Tax=Elusimicrobium simillimum TaxID=3143438 RepID=UPI003C7043F0